jgi:transcriptional regulator with XRE-family HTH domain
LNMYDRIKEKRIELGMSQEDLANKTGYTSRSSIAKIEKGEVDLSQKKIFAFAKALDLNVGELMEVDEQLNYDIDGDTLEKVREILLDKNARILLDAKRELTQANLEAVTELIARLKVNKKGE